MTQSSKPILALDTHELAWAAGFFDGEGSVCLRHRGNWRELWFQVPQSEPGTLLRFQRAIGGLGKVGGPWLTRNGHLPQYRLDIRGYIGVQAAIAMLWRFLSEPKREQAFAAMADCKEYFQRRALHGKGPAKLTLREAADLRIRHVAAQSGRLRVPRGWVAIEAARFGVSPHTIAHIVKGRGYAETRA